MIATISAIGRLGNDPEQKVSIKGAEYILFDLAVDRDFGDRKETDWYRCIAFGSTKERILKPKAAKGSLVHVIGAQELEKFKHKDGSEGMAPKITLYDLEYVPGSGKKGYSHRPQRHNSRLMPETMESKRSKSPKISCPFSPMDERGN